jgi:uncharacterized repeat protein (TIGR01451 family)
MKISRKFLKKIVLNFSFYLTVLAMLVNISSPTLYAVALAVENNEAQEEIVEEPKDEPEEEVEEEVPVEEEETEPTPEENSEVEEVEEGDEEEPAAEEGEVEEGDEEEPVIEKEIPAEEEAEKGEENSDKQDSSESDGVEQEEEPVVENNEPMNNSVQDEENDDNEDIEIGKWEENDDGSMSIIVEKNEEYEYKDSGLKIEFKEIEDGTGEITVEEIELTDEQVKKLGALSNKAWDITSEMENGTFEYDLTLPNEENADEDEVKVVYVEDKDDLDKEKKIKEVDKKDVKVDNEKKEIKAGNLDHFTVFVPIKGNKDDSISLSAVIASLGETISGAGCIEDAAGESLNCTANDISLANVTGIEILDGGCSSPDDTVTFRAKWDVQSTATERYDVGLYFSEDGDPNNDGALSGSCSVSILPNSPMPPWFDFDGDMCGDASSSAIVEPVIEMTVKCIDENENNALDLPYCTSWDNQAGGICSSPVNAIPSQKSKCNCNDGFQVPITVPYAAEIEVIKNLIPDTDAGRFNLIIDEGEDFEIKKENVGNNGTTGKVVVGAGTSDIPGATHTVGEIAYSGTDLNDYNTEISCVDRVTGALVASSPSTGPLNVDVDKDDDIVCTITNTYKSGTIEIIKNTQGGDETFNFMTTGGGNLPGSFNITTSGGSGNQIYGNLTAGSYTVAEGDSPMGWKFENLSCESANETSLISTDNKIASIDLAANDYVTCTYSNSKNSNLTVYKNVVNDDGGNLAPSDFQLYLKKDGVNVFGSPFGGSETGTVFSIESGTYVVSEDSKSGYSQKSIVCDGQENDTITLGYGESKSCTITNDDQPGTLIVEKNLINDNNGQKACEDFSFSYNTSGAIAFEEDCRNEITVPAGTYDVAESSATGYDTTYSGCSGINIPNGGSATCTITNDDQQGKLIIEKVLLKDNGGNETYSDFSFKINGGADNSFESDGENEYSVDAGTYTVVENSKDGYEITYNNCENVFVANGETKTCTITNDDIAPSITLIKEVVNNNGGTAGVNDFGLSVGATSVNSNQKLSVLANTAYAIDEAGLAGYEFVSITGDKCPSALGETITLDEGDDVTCTITNNDIAPGLTVKKEVINDNGGNATVSDFNIQMNDSALSFGSGITVDNTTTYIATPTVIANQDYTLSEDDFAGYQEGTWSCTDGTNGTGLNVTVNLDEGDDVTCTITNNDIAPKLTLVKDPTNDNGGNALPDDFKLTIGGDVAISGTPYTLESNTAYSIDETMVDGYEFVSITGDKCPSALGETITLDEGDDVTCTITNNDVFGEIIVEKQTLPDGNTESFIFNASYSSDFSLSDGQTNNSGPLVPGTYSVSEQVSAGWDLTDASCLVNENSSSSFDPRADSFILGKNDVIHCTFTNTKRGEIIVTKWNDTENDKYFNGEEEKLEGWEMNISPGDKTETTDANGEALFQDVVPGSYVLSETLKEGWLQTSIYCEEETREVFAEALAVLVEMPVDNEGYELSLNPGEIKRCFVGNQFIESELFVSKTNNEYDDGPEKPGDLVTYTIEVQAKGNGVKNARVTDLPPETFEYVAGSWTVESSIDGNINIPEPTYSSPGDWELGDMEKDEVVTLTYQARVGENTETGVYPDLAWAQGENMANEKLIALSTDSDFSVNQGVVDENYVGTQIEVENPEAPPTVKVRADKDEVIEEVEEEVKVLGATFPATGASNNWLLTALIGMLAGSLMIGLGYLIKNRRKMKIGKIFGMLVGIIFTGFLAGNVMAAGISVRVSEPDDKINKAFNLEFVAMDIEDREMTAKCQKKSSSDADFVQFGSDISLKAGGDSDLCPVDSGVLNGDGNYEFRVLVIADGGEEKISNTVITYYDGVGPRKPEYIEKKDEDGCSNEIKFKTANDGQTAYVEIYRSQHTRDIVANNDSLRKTIVIGPNKTHTFRDGTLATGCGDNYFYAIRAFDDAGNPSGVREEVFEEIVEEKEIVEIIENQEGVALNLETGEEGTEGEEEIVEGEGNEEVTEDGEPVIDEGAQTEGEENETDVLGEQDNVGMNWLSDWRIWLAIILIAGAGWFVYNKRKEK